MDALIAIIKNHKRDTAAALAVLAGLGHFVGAEWAITAPWFHHSLSTMEYLAGAVGALGWAHAAMKQPETAAQG